MKVVAKAIDVVSWTDRAGVITPVRFRLTNEDEKDTVIKIERVITKSIMDPRIQTKKHLFFS